MERLLVTWQSRRSWLVVTLVLTSLRNYSTSEMDESWMCQCWVGTSQGCKIQHDSEQNKNMCSTWWESSPQVFWAQCSSWSRTILSEAEPCVPSLWCSPGPLSAPASSPTVSECSAVEIWAAPAPVLVSESLHAVCGLECPQGTPDAVWHTEAWTWRGAGRKTTVVCPLPWKGRELTSLDKRYTMTKNYGGLSASLSERGENRRR